MIVFSHRANLNGPNPEAENSLSATRAALELGFGLETDLRKNGDGRFYIAHDSGAWSESNDFAQFSRLFQEHAGACIAMNVKELGYEKDLVDLMLSGRLGTNAFYFDFELLEPQQPGRTQNLIHSLPRGPKVRMAARLSDRGERMEQCLGIPAKIVWADEFDSLWLERHHVETVQREGRRFYVISPELHGFGEADRLRRWADFKAWGIDGLCTDYALQAREFFLR